jgi:hypothetical protein
MPVQFHKAAGILLPFPISSIYSHYISCELHAIKGLLSNKREEGAGNKQPKVAVLTDENRLQFHGNGRMR